MFVYNRLDHTQQAVGSLQTNNLALKSELVIYSDGPATDRDVEKVRKVREFLRTIDGFNSVSIVERERNLGLAGSVIDGVTRECKNHGKVIVLEDDLITTPFFLEYMNSALSAYEHNDSIFVISGYSPKINTPWFFKDDVYLTQRSSSWGWGTWAAEWSQVVWDNSYYARYVADESIMARFAAYGGSDRPAMLKKQVSGELDSWAIRRAFTQFMLKKYTLYPKQTLVRNIGFDGSGVHCGDNAGFDEQNYLAKVKPVLPRQPRANSIIDKKIRRYYSQDSKQDQAIGRRLMRDLKSFIQVRK